MSQSPEAAGVPTCHRHPGREAHIRCQRCERPICPDCMIPAAVGFQCPDCVKQGRKETRSGRTTYGGMRPTNAAVTSGALIALNVGVWIAILVTGGNDSWLLQQLLLRTDGLCLAGGGGYDVTAAECTRLGTWAPGVVDGALWQPLTSMFAHVEVFHIGLNMLALWILGPQLEMLFGRTRFLALYFVSGLAGSALVMWAANPFTPTIGASGAIFGLIAALLLVAYRTGGDYRAVLVLVVLNFVITFTVPNISWQGHVGGFLGGLAITAVLVFSPRGPKRARYQWLGLAVIAFVVLLALVARVAFPA